MKDVLLAVFPEFFASDNEDAAVQFSINAAILDRQLPILLRVLDVKNDLGEIGGAPGWTIERRKPSAAPEAYITWPTWAVFRTEVFPECYSLRFPERFSTEAQFLSCLKRLLMAYAEQNPAIIAEMME